MQQILKYNNEFTQSIYTCIYTKKDSNTFLWWAAEWSLHSKLVKMALGITEIKQYGQLFARQ